MRDSLKQGQDPFLKDPFRSNEPSKEEPEEEEEDSLFGPSKARARETTRVNVAEDSIMSRKTFNDDLLFKKKPVMLEKKEPEKQRNNLFGNDSGSDK